MFPKSLDLHRKTCLYFRAVLVFLNLKSFLVHKRTRFAGCYGLMSSTKRKNGSSIVRDFYVNEYSFLLRNVLYMWQYFRRWHELFAWLKRTCSLQLRIFALAHFRWWIKRYEVRVTQFYLSLYLSKLGHVPMPLNMQRKNRSIFINKNGNESTSTNV